MTAAHQAEPPPAVPAPSGFAAGALWVTLLNGAANALLLLGNTYAARCLGPVNVGISAQVVVAVQQAALAFNGGLDTTSVRLVASGGAAAADVGRAVLAFRVAVAIPLALAWVAFVLATQAPGLVRTAWLLGAPLLVLASVQLPFLFQAMERMPRWAALSALSAALTAACYGLFFHPGMPVGSDLWVISGVGAVVAIIALAQAAQLAQLRVAGALRSLDACARLAAGLLTQSWRYWLIALLVFFYTAFPVLLVAQLQGDAAAGVLRVCLQLAGGLELVFAGINSLLLPRLVRWREEGDQRLWAGQTRQLKWHALVGGGMFLLAALVAPWVFGGFLGAQFRSGLAPFLVLAAGRVVVFLGQVFAWGVVALRLDAALLVATVCAVITSLGLNLVLIPRYSVMGAAIAALCAEIVIGVVCFAWQRRHLARASIRN